MNKYFTIISFMMFIVSDAFSMNILQAYETFKKENYKELLTSAPPEDKEVLMFCKVFAQKMKEDKEKCGETLLIPAWAVMNLEKKDYENSWQFAAIAMDKGNELIKKWALERGRLWLNFSKELGADLSEEDEHYIESMESALREQQTFKFDNYDELLSGLDDIEESENIE